MSDDRKLQLLADRVTEGLSAAEEAELAGLLDGGDAREIEEMELAAAALDLALASNLVRPAEPMPDAVRDRISAAVTARTQAATAADPARVAREELAEVVPMRRSSTLPWLAAAAGFLLAVVAWWPQGSPPAIPDLPAPVPAPAPTVAELRESLITEATDESILAWSATEDPTAAGAGGDVVWSADQQQGFMRFSGLAANDPSEFQYQLWIFDRGRDERYPVDGGVFDIPAGGGEVVVPIAAKLPVGEAYLFAITIEPPGGVVVSSRERIALLAQPT